MKSTARKLRKHATDAERLLWKRIRNRQLNGYKVRRQYEIEAYIIDFVCLEAMLIIEVDGGHHNEQLKEDKHRTVYLESLGYRIIRYWNNEIMSDISGVLESIMCLLKDPSPQPSPSGRGESSGTKRSYES